MRPYLTALALCAALTAPAPADVQPQPSSVDVVNVLDQFISSYHRQPVPERAPAMLDLALADKSGVVFGRPLDVVAGLVANRGAMLAHSLGWMARGRGSLVRQYEARFAAASAPGRMCILTALRICGDAQTRKQLDRWAADPNFAACKAEIASTRAALAETPRQLPRDKAAVAKQGIDLLWADFFATGAYEPVCRILDVLDLPDTLRDPIAKKLSEGGAGQAEFRATLKQLKVIQAGGQDRLIAGDLDLFLLHDPKGRLSDAGCIAVEKLTRRLNLSKEAFRAGVDLKSAASWSLQAVLPNDPRLAELLKRHCAERPAGSRDLLQKWLCIDQPKVELTAEMQALQGTWLIDSAKPEPEDSTAQFAAVMLKENVAWTFLRDELQMAFGMVQNGRFRRDPVAPMTISSYKVRADQNPKVLTMTEQGSSEADEAIYEIDGDTLRICLSPKDGPLPKEFSAPQGSGRTLFILKKMPQ